VNTRKVLVLGSTAMIVLFTTLMGALWAANGQDEPAPPPAHDAHDHGKDAVTQEADAAAPADASGKTMEHGAMACPAMSGGSDKVDCQARLAAVLKSLDTVEQAINTHDSKTALAKLAQARDVLTGMQKSMLTGSIVNVRCPIMGNPIDPAKTSETLTRTFKGKNIAFCCAGCPAEWDKLTDEQKDRKLAVAYPAQTGEKRESVTADTCKSHCK
jgi:hypothetical protein